ncbi:MAG TPA: AgmX/PglI C-terminal domain-containing protein [Polyangiaceae bacterium]|nr:AgmX/PglI C-terminal domain-containing protein [Polyangiaceae bacterium]
MRKKPLFISLALAGTLGVGLVLISRTRPEGGGGDSSRGDDVARPSLDRVRIAESGSLYRFASEAAERGERGEKGEKKKGDEPAASIALTASDGTGLKLAALDSRGVIEGPLAFTEIRLAFDNPEDRTLEGTFRVTLPQGATISRFAMRQGDRWQEGEVVEKQAARRAYEDFLHRRQDPALLEQAAGNEFSARVFPIPARGRKELIVSYSQEITPEAPYVVPLRGLPQVGKLDAVVARAGDDAPLLGQVHLENAAPAHDLAVDAAKLGAGDGVRAGELALLRVRPAAEAGRDPVESALVLVDTSASRALGFEAEIGLVAAVASGLGPARLLVAAFDQGIDVVYEGPAAGFAQAGAAALRERQALGASDLEAAISWARGRAQASKSSRVILVSDGVPTLGVSEPAELRNAAAALRGAGVERLDVLAVGGIRDDAQLRALCTAGLPRDGVVIDGAKGAEQALRRLTSATRSVDVTIAGAEWQWPERLEGLQPGDEALVYAKLPAASVAKLAVGGASSDVKLVEVERPLLERAWVSAKIAQLVQKPPAGQSEEATRAEIVRLSTTFRVLSPHTSLLVLETEQDYERYKIDRKALADILTVQGTKLARQQRHDETAVLPVKPVEARPAPPSDGVVLRAPPAGPEPAAGRAPRMAGGREADDREGGTGTRAKGEEGSLGPPAAKPAENRPRPQVAATAAPPPAPAPSAAPGSDARNAALADAAEFGTIGLLGGDPVAGGLGLSGVGEGGGGRGEGIGLGRVGTIGHGSGQGTGQGFGSGQGRLGGGGRLDGSRAGSPQLRGGNAQVSGRLSPEVIQRIVRQNFGRFRLCYEAGLRQSPGLKGRVNVRFVIARDGSVASVANGGSDLPDSSVVSCVVRAFQGLNFPQPEGGIVTVIYPLAFAGSGDQLPALPERSASGEPRVPALPPSPRFGPYEGRLAAVMEALSKGDKPEALRQAIAFRAASPGDVMAMVALGEAFEAAGETRSAARAYGSLIDLFSSRADLRRMAGERLERLNAPYAHALAADSYAKAAQQRPDHPSSHRLLAYARLRAGDFAGAFDAIEKGAGRSYPAGRFRGVERILREDAALIGAAWAKAEPREEASINRRLGALGVAPEKEPSLRFVLNWETDANDVDFHIRDSRGGHAFYSSKSLPSGGELYDDVTTGYGPECFTVRQGPGQRAEPYRLQAHYYSRGPMGYGMGKLEIIEHDGKGGLTFEQRPFVIMQDRAFVELGTYPAGATIESSAGAELPRP